MLTGNDQILTVNSNASDKDLMNDHASGSSDSSISSTPTDLPLLIHTSPTQEQQVITSPAPLLNDNIVCKVNNKNQTSSKATSQSSTISKKTICATKKRPASPEEPIELRLKRSRVKKIN